MNAVLQGNNTVFVIEELDNPSTDFFVLPALLSSGRQVVRCGFNDLPDPADLTGAVVVFVRYVPGAWVKLVEATRAALHALIFFMDDDVLDFRASIGMPLKYRFKLARLATRRSGWLQKQAVELWVSNAYLQQKYAQWQPRLVLPSPLVNRTDIRRVFYHGSVATHRDDIRWLRPVAEDVLRRDPRVAFEIVGRKDVWRLYKDLPRVTVVHPMKWPAYQTFLAMQERHVGLNPLQDVPFNRARSYTKFFDITRCGAVGVYTPDSACSGIINNGREGLVVALDQADWVEAILSLVQDEPLRRTLLQNAQAKMRELAGEAQRGYANLIQ